MSHVLILVGSVRPNGNTQALAQACADGARAAGHQVEVVSVADYHVHPCTGCEGCSKHPGNQCRTICRKSTPSSCGRTWW